MDEHLTDVRDSFPNDKNAQHFLLQNSVPDRFHAVCAKNMPKEDYIKSTLGLDLLTVVIRHLYCFLNPKFLALDDMDGGSERRLIRWTWSNFSEDATKHHPSHAIRYSILKSYYPGGALRGNDLSFLALEEHDITYNSFWRRTPFLLFAPFHIKRATDSSSWHHSPVRNLVDLKVLARAQSNKMGSFTRIYMRLPLSSCQLLLTRQRSHQIRCANSSFHRNIV